MEIVKSRVLLAVVFLALGAGAGALGMGLARGTPTARSAQAAGDYPGMMGGGGMTGGGSGSMMGSVAQIPGGAPGGLVPVKTLQASAASVARTVQRSGAQITYNTSQVTMVAVGAPGNKPGMFWQIDGVDNASVSIPSGSTVTVDFADGDPGQSHGFEVTTAAPPYPWMAMMDGVIAASGAFVMPVPPPVGNSWYSDTTSFAAPSPGTYYIICPVPGHAQKGMWSRLIVR